MTKLAEVTELCNRQAEINEAIQVLEYYVNKDESPVRHTTLSRLEELYLEKLNVEAEIDEKVAFKPKRGWFWKLFQK